MYNAETLEKVIATKDKHIDSKQRRENIKKWTDFYRKNLDIYITDFLGIPLFQYQKNMVNTIQDGDVTVLVCSRGSSKTFMTACTATAYATLYSNCNVIVTSLTLSQSNLLISAKLDKELSNEKTGLSPILRQYRKDGYLTFHRDTNTGGLIAEFDNGSKIIACALGESMRGQRAQIVILDEAAICSKSVYQSVAEPTLTQRMFNGRPVDYVEEPKQVFLSSARSKTNWLWRYLTKVVSGYYKGGRIKYGFMCVDALSAVCAGIQSPNQYYQRKKNTDDLTFQQEYLNIFLGENENSLFKLSDFEDNQVLEKAFYPRSLNNILDGKENTYNYSDDCVRIVACDIALSGGSEDDASCFLLMSINKNTGARKIEYLVPKEGLNTLSQVVWIKRLFYEYQAHYCVLDTKGVGQGIFDLLTTETTDTEYGKVYPAWTVTLDNTLQLTSDTVINDKVQRTISDDAQEVIIPFVGTAELNSQGHLSIRKALRDRYLSLLKDEYEMQEIISDNDPSFITKSSVEKAEILLPFLQTRMLMNEAIALEMKITETGLVKLQESTRTNRKDMYMTAMMANLVADKIQLKCQKNENNDEWSMDDWSFLSN